MGVGDSVVKRREEDRFLLGPDEGVGVETLTEAEEQRNGSSFILDEVTVRWDEETPCDDEDEPTAAGRSSSDGGMIPSSVYKKSIWTIISDSCVIRLLCQNSIKQSALFRKNNRSRKLTTSLLPRTSSFSSFENRSGVTSRFAPGLAQSSPEANAASVISG